MIAIIQFFSDASNHPTSRFRQNANDLNDPSAIPVQPAIVLDIVASF
jgi:hypothetical protein